MSHPVALTQPISGAHAVKLYPGFGIKGSDVPNDGDNGASPVANDNLIADAEYAWRVVTQPSSGVLTIYPDLSYLLDGAAVGEVVWEYELLEYGQPQTPLGVVTVTVTPEAVVLHSAVGALVAGSAVLTGSAVRIGAAANHVAVGSLVAGSASVAAAASREAGFVALVHSASGALIAGSALLGAVATREAWVPGPTVERFSLVSRMTQRVDLVSTLSGRFYE